MSKATELDEDEEEMEGKVLGGGRMMRSVQYLLILHVGQLVSHH